jgi:hypothetical protein
VILLAIAKLLASRTLLVQQHLVIQGSFAIPQFSNPATLSNPAIVCNSTRFSDLVMPSNPATFSNPLMLSNADDVRLTSPSQSKDVHNNNSTPTASNLLEGKTTAVIAVMRGNPKDGYTCLCSNKHCNQ